MFDKDDCIFTEIRPKPMKLRPLRANGRGGDWGKPDSALAKVVFRNMAEANPPTVIAWSPFEGKMRRCLQYNHGDVLRLDDLRKLIPERFGAIRATVQWFASTPSIRRPIYDREDWQRHVNDPRGEYSDATLLTNYGAKPHG